MNTDATASNSIALSVRGVVKRFDDNLALDHVDFDLRAGEIHALLGENGAGKSTLMNVLRGLVRPTTGEIQIRGTRITIDSPRRASAMGIGMVHQHFLLVPVLSVIDNLILAARQTTFFRDRATTKPAALATANRLGWSIPLDAIVRDLSVGVQQRVEILKALHGDASILLFDEPTAVLTPSEAAELFVVLRALRDEGRSIVFVSHKLTEVMELCDRVTVLRRGRHAGTVDVTDTNPRDLASRMVGENVAAATATTLASAGGLVTEGATFDDQTVLRESTTTAASIDVMRVVGLSTPRRHKDETSLENLDFALAPRDILAFAGVDGNGQEELFQALTGLRRFRSDRFELGGESVKRLTTGSLARREIAVIPPDRQTQGLALGLSVADNLTLEAARMRAYRIGPFLRRRALRELAGRLKTDFDVRTTTIAAPASSLSGGNQQKIVIARALWRRPKLLIAASPTRGLDVAATAYVHDKIRECASGGTATVLISTELDEIYALATRIAVLYAGRIVGIVGPKTPRETVGLMMGGHVESAHLPAKRGPLPPATEGP